MLVLNTPSGKIELGDVVLVSQLPRQKCDHCGQDSCRCHTEFHGRQVTEEDMIARNRYNAALHAIESLLLALANEGVVREDNKTEVANAVQTAIDACENNLF